MTEYLLALEATIEVPAVQHWIGHAKFHATSDDRGYPTGEFDWQRFHDALAVYKFRPCCGGPQFMAEYRVTELLYADWWWAYREAMLAYVATYITSAEAA